MAESEGLFVTTIAWDGKQLAGDRQGNYGGTRVLLRKVHLIKTKTGGEYLVGAAGDSCLIAAWTRWVVGDGPEPSFKSGDEFTALMIDRSRRIWKVEWNLVHVRCLNRRMAIGSGRGEALGAMSMGASAPTAIRIASKWDASTGCGVDVVSF